MSPTGKRPTMKRLEPPTDAPVKTLEAMFACAFLPILYGSTRPDPIVDEDNIRSAIRLGRLAAKIMANAKE